MYAMYTYGKNWNYNMVLYHVCAQMGMGHYCMYVCMYVSTYVCMHVYICTCVYGSYVYMCIYVHVCVCIHIMYSMTMYIYCVWSYVVHNGMYECMYVCYGSYACMHACMYV